MVFEFTQDCITGIDTIDDEHRNLFALLSKAYNLASTEYHSDYYQEVKNILAELEEYADTHFTHEEEYQRVLTELVRFLAKWLYRHILSSDILIGKLPPLEEWMIRENPCEFTEDYLTGIALVDAEHKELFHIVDKADKLVKSFDELSGYDNINELKEYTKEHFSDEEEYMEGIQYEGLSAQKRAHEAFIDKLENIDLDQIDANPQEYLQELLEFLLGWLINHILYTDKKIPLH